MNEIQNPPAVQKAIQTLTSFKNASMKFARQEDFENVSQQYQPVVSIVHFEPKDFVDVGMGNMYPGKSATNRIGDASGVSFLEGVGGTREEGSATAIKIVKQAGGYFQIEGKYIVIGSAQGERLKPDGTPRKSSVCEYGYDVVNRTNAEIVKDFQKDQNEQKLTTEIACRQKFLEVQKFAVQRARTGAELGVIRELVGLPTAFKKGEVANGCDMLFSQVIENNTFKVQVLAEIGRTPDGRAAIVQALFGATRSVFGPGAVPAGLPAAAETRQLEAQPAAAQESDPALAQRKIDHETGEITEPASVEEGQADLFQDDIPFPETTEEKIKRIREQIVDLLKDPGISEKNRDDGLKWLATKGADDLDKLTEKQTLIEGAIKNYRLRAEQLKKGRKAS
jgi:hypothetical protein